MRNGLTWLKSRPHVLWFVAVAVLAAVFVRVVDLRPQVGTDFFFGSDDPAFQDTARIRELFPSDEQLIISAASPHITSAEYLSQITTLSTRVATLPGVLRVLSVSQGPGTVEKALDSPLWRRLLIDESQTSTLVIAFVDPLDGAALVRSVEEIVGELHGEAFELRVSGMPYIVEMIRRSLVTDLKTFNAAAVLIFGALIVWVFRSARVLCGTLTACLAAILGTLLVQSLLGAAIGPLTANLSTIVFVLTQSHIIFLTANWQRVAREGEAVPDTVRQAVRRTFTASCWCMLTTLLGFVSLLFVEAQPLRELGLGGAIGTLMAIACAYLIYPAFMRWTGTPPEQSGAQSATTTPLLKPVSPLGYPRVAAVAAVLLGIGMLRLDTDPSLLAYFKPGSELRDGLEFIDRNGGSSPLQLVVGMPDDGRLDNDEGYGRMWGLQGALSANPSVGTAVSLPVLMAEGHTKPVASLLSWRHLLNVMSWFDGVATNFVTPDRTQAMYLLRMTETGRGERRQEILADLERVVESQGLKVNLVGGIYALQGHLAQLVSASLITGLAALLALFGAVAYLVSRSRRTSLAMVSGVALVPAVMFGVIGLFGVPVDIISAPAGNVCIGIGVDAMIHLAMAVRRRMRAGSPDGAAWAAALQEQARPTLVAAGIVAAGFAIFALSGFPPTQRFGLAVVLGATVAAVATLVVFPAWAWSGVAESSTPGHVDALPPVQDETPYAGHPAVLAATDFSDERCMGAIENTVEHRR